MKIAFIDHSFHKKTKSSNFFKEIIENNNDISYFWDESWNNEESINIDEINNGNFDIIIFWQIILKPKQIQKIRCKNIIWIPMYDTEILRKLYKIQYIGYLKFNIKIISFSESLTKKMKDIGFDVLTLQYYPEPKDVKDKNFDNLNILFWQRIKNIDIKLINKIIPTNKIIKIFYKNNPDSNKKIESPKQKNVETINGWLSDENYCELLNKCNIFIAPRKYEGIGMSFLDAMAYGLVVISPDFPTANEYIKNNYNGYLYDLKNPKPIDLSMIKSVSKNIKKSLKDGYSNWLEDKEKINDFIKITNYKINIKHEFLYFIYKIYSPLLELMRKIKRLLKIKFY